MAELVVNEVNAPDMIGILWPQADNGAVFVVESHIHHHSKADDFR